MAWTPAFLSDRIHRWKVAHRESNRWLQKVERSRGPLSKALRRRADEYAREVFGSRRHSRWLQFYAAVRGEFLDGWIPFSYFLDEVLPRVNFVRELAPMRHLTRQFLRTEAVPDVACVLRGQLLDVQFAPWAPAHAAESIFSQADVCYFKTNGSCRGRGVVRLTREEFLKIDWSRQPSGVIQKPIIPHHFFDRMLPDRGPTLRVMTVLEPCGRAAVRTCYLRLARHTRDRVDADWQFNINVGVTDGRLMDHGFDSNYQAFTAHPDTGVEFQGLVYPFYESAVAQLCRWHEEFRLTGVIGWDICIDRNDRLRIYEWNLGLADIRFAEATRGPFLGGLGWEQLWKRRAAGAGNQSRGDNFRGDVGVGSE